MTQPTPNQPPLSILLCTPTRGGFSPSYKQSARALEAWCRAQQIPYDERAVAEAPVEVARDLLAAEFLTAQHDGQPYSHCLMIDAGVGFSVDTIHQMLRADEPFVAAAVPLRRTDAPKAAARGDARFAPTFSVQFPRTTRETGKVRLVSKSGAAFAQVEVIGAACMCLRREVFLRMYDGYPELAHKSGFTYFAPTLLNEQNASHVTILRDALRRARDVLEHPAETGGDARQRIEAALALSPEEFDRCGEDVSFCRRWIALGTPESPAEIWLLCDAPLVHEGHGYFSGNLADSFD